jgi:hypothetical protein
MRKYKTYLKPVWVEDRKALHMLNSREAEYLWRGADDVLESDGVMEYLTKVPNDDITKAEKLDVPVEDIIGWTILDTRIKSQLLKWKKLKKEQGEEC